MSIAVESFLSFLRENKFQVLEAVGTHLILSVLAILLAFFIALPLAIIGSWKIPSISTLIGILHSLRVIPSLAILAILVPLLGLGFAPALVALTILAIPPILLGAYSGIAGVAPDLIEAAQSLGMTKYQIMWQVQLPVARKSILSGLRIATIEVIASASLAAYVGAGGLGEFIMMGLGLYDVGIMLVGALPIAFLALIGQSLFIVLEKHY